MRIPTWRLALTGSAIVILAAVGVGLVAASSNGPSAPAAPAAAAPSAAPATGAGDGSIRERAKARLARMIGARPFAKHLVHATITATGTDGHLVTFQLDHGSIASVGSGSLTITEQGGASITVSTDANTVVFLGRGAGKGSLGDLKVGDEVFVQSRIDGATTLAKHVLRAPAWTTS